MNIFLTTKERRAVNARNHLSQAELVYLVTDIPEGTTDEEILKQVSSTSPKEIGYASRVETRITDRPGQKSCEVAVTYASENESDTVPRVVKRPGDEIWLIVGKTGREKIYQGVSTQKYPIEATVAPNPENWIRWNGGFGSDFRAEGTWIYAPKMQEKCIRTFDPDQITRNYRRIIMESIGTVNNAAFHGWEKGEVLLLEAQQSKEYRNEKGNWLADITFLFGISPNRYRDVAQHLISVGGWQVPWGLTGLNDCWALDTPAFYVSTVYNSSDFSRLKVGHNDSGAALRCRIRELKEE
ncbi:MAG: hypothetical protein MJ033_01515 [Victivallaceae bacterium]|nr:hypothetical protein [Victivallaceae bacterium]